MTKKGQMDKESGLIFIMYFLLPSILHILFYSVFIKILISGNEREEEENSGGEIGKVNSGLVHQGFSPNSAVQLSIEKVRGQA